MLDTHSRQATLTCPQCGARTLETMPETACLYFWQCPCCDNLSKPLHGDCCVFCSFGEQPCPPRRAEHIQQERP